MNKKNLIIFVVILIIIVILSTSLILRNTQDLLPHNSTEKGWENVTTKDACEEIGGIWGMFSNLEGAKSECNYPTPDSGKKCTDSKECTSYCQAKEGAETNSQDSGTCYGFEIAVCMKEVRDNIVDGEWCH